jgi:hypothetical protein
MNHDDYVHYDDHNKQVSDLENQIEDLKLTVSTLIDDEVYTLSELMLIRDDIDRGMPMQIIRGEIAKLIAIHSTEVREKAIERIAERFEA